MSDNPLHPPHNPFAAPTQSPSFPQGHGKRQPGRGYVRQIPILATMTIVQGALLLVMGIFCAGYGIVIVTMMRTGNMPMPPDAPPMEIVSIGLIGVGILVLIIAIMHIIAGIRNLKYRGRGFTMVTWMLGLLASCTCYCAPTSVGLAIWGLIVFLNPAVVLAFKMAETGMTSREIEDQFY